MDRLQDVQEYLDVRARAKVDPNYIEVPAKPWRVILRYKENMVDVDYDNYTENPGTNESADWRLCFEPPIASSIGFWVGYRGTGISFSKSLTKNAGRYYSFSTTGAKYGFNFRLRRFNTSEGTLTGTEYVDGQVSGTPTDTVFHMDATTSFRCVALLSTPWLCIPSAYITA